MTIKTIAENLGVSYSTVSRCLNNDPRVSEKTRQRVLEEARRTGFTFNMNARSLVKKKSERIGIIFSDNFNTKDYRWLFNEIETYSTREIEKNGYDYIIQPLRTHNGISNIYRLINSRLVDGLIIFAKDVTEDEYRFLKENNFPHVFVYFKPECHDESLGNFFCDDSEYGGYLATNYLIENGHKKILTVTTNNPQQKLYRGRTEGYLKAMSKAGLSPEILSVEMEFLSAKSWYPKYKDYLMSFTGIFFQRDLPALSVIQELNKDQIYVPKDISIIGYNNIDLIDYLDIPLDVIWDLREELIENAISYLISVIEKKEDTFARLVRPTLVTRNSVKKL